MTWKEVQDAVSENRVVTIVVGSTEQHGPHLPLGTDSYIPLGIAERAASKIRMVIAPPVTYGYYSQVRSGGGGENFPGTTSVRSSTLVGLITDLIEAFIRHGFQRFLILSGHYENSPLIGESVQRALTSSGRTNVRTLLVNWWELIPPETLNEVYENNFPGWEIEHAAIAETSMLMALRPELVRIDQIRDYKIPRKVAYDIIPPAEDTIPEAGVPSKATPATKEKGEILIRTAVEKLVEAVNKDLIH
jgi:creatinine amidohydrolase